MSVVIVKYPLIIVNLKTYKESTGENAVRLASTAEKVSRETGVCVAVSPQTVDLRAVIDNISRDSCLR